ncbi:hypothetical protein HDU67_010155 [Dinochytrium kinnereticum]|nr:hypothetical protein HDU67_010155 [Dinochytrium kinnereticum]
MKNKPSVVVAIYDYHGSTDEELDFREGDVMEIINDENPDWWYVRNGDEEGYVPTTYIAANAEVKEGNSPRGNRKASFGSPNVYESRDELVQKVPRKKYFTESSIAEKWSQEIEETLGWGVLPLFTSDGGPIENKTYDIRVYDKNPFAFGSARSQSVDKKATYPITLYPFYQPSQYCQHTGEFSQNAD